MIKEVDIINGLMKKGYRITKTRKDIINCLFDNNHDHSINEIVSHLNKKNKQINVSSTYNTIEILIHEGFVDQRINHKDKIIYYEIINPNNKHFHIYNMDNNEEYLLDLPNPIINEIENLIKKNFNQNLYHLKIEAKIKK